LIDGVDVLSEVRVDVVGEDAIDFFSAHEYNSNVKLDYWMVRIRQQTLILFMNKMDASIFVSE